MPWACPIISIDYCACACASGGPPCPMLMAGPTRARNVEPTFVDACLLSRELPRESCPPRCSGLSSVINHAFWPPSAARAERCFGSPPEGAAAIAPEEPTPLDDRVSSETTLLFSRALLVVVVVVVCCCCCCRCRTEKLFVCCCCC